MELIQLLERKPEDLLVPDENNVKEALEGIKLALDPVAKQHSVLDKIHVEGLAVDQVWLQAQMVVDGALKGLFGELQSLVPESDESSESDGESAASNLDEDGTEFAGVSEPELDSNENSDSDELNEELNEEEDFEELDEDQDDEGENELEEDEDGLEDNEDEGKILYQPPIKRKKIEGLEDDTFDLAEYQQHVLALEQMDQDNDDDDEDIDYFAERQPGESDSDEAIYYDDFFGAKTRSSGSGNADTELEKGGEEADATIYESAQESFRKDLFDSGSESELDLDETEPGKGLSKFEKQQLDIEAQIKEYERENVSEKDWGMRGEIRANQRPQDSLVNAELEFDRNAKPAPVVTQEYTQSLEDLIRDRIRKEQFDDLPRRTLAPQMEKSRKVLPEVQETRSEKGLAELYEEDYAKKTNPEFYAQKANEGLEKAHKEVIDLYAALGRKLDSLCSWSYTPKAPEAGLEIKTDAPAISMEEAQPSTMSVAAGLAPQEVFRADKDSFVASEEMSKSSKKRRQNQRAKAKAAKQEAKEAARKESGAKTDSNEKVFSALKRSNVTVIDKRGRKRDLRGNKVSEKAPLQASQIKL